VNVFFWLVCGALAGIMASRRSRAPREVLRNAIVGAAGAMAGGWLVTPYLGHAAAQDAELSIAGLVIATAAAVVLLIAAALYRQGVLR
jgi:uncharacterized membrane protein YeaQ/YmgE (transglycosylase-associated protein family)